MKPHLVVAILLLLSIRASAKPADFGLPVERFKVDGHDAFLLKPSDHPKENRPWAVYAPTLSRYPDKHEKWLHQQLVQAGITVAGVDTGESYGSPASRKVFDKFYDHLTKQGYAKKPCLIARSRGGLWQSNWAIDHPNRFAALAGIYPVFDLRSYPGLEKAAPQYKLTAEELEQQLDKHNPVSRIAALAKAGLPVMLVHGDADKVVPIDANALRVQAIYKQAGKQELFKLTVFPGQAHTVWEGFFHNKEFVDFVIKHAQQGAKAAQKK